MGITSIEWTDRTWNPTRGCSRISEGCRHCYAERQASRFSGLHRPFDGFVRIQTGIGPQWTGKVELVESHLTDPLGWKKPQRVFVNSMSDLFHEALQLNAIKSVFDVMQKAYWHTFQILTKRADRMFEVCEWLKENYDDEYPLPNIWLGVSVEDQRTADERIPLLLKTPAWTRFVSYEPALGRVDFKHLQHRREVEVDSLDGTHGVLRPHGGRNAKLDWVIVGGESGPGARPFDIYWARQTIEQCRNAGVACFVKQLGANPMYRSHGDDNPKHLFNGLQPLFCNGEPLKDKKGGSMEEWPYELRVRQFPGTANASHEANS